MSLTNGFGAGAFGLPLQPSGPNTQFPLNGGGGPVMLPGGGHNFGPAGGGMGGGGMGQGLLGHDGRLAALLPQLQAFHDARQDWREGGREGDRPRLSSFLQEYRDQRFRSGPFAHRNPANY